MLQVSIKKKLWYFDLDIDFKINNDQILVLWGPSGTGKTTVLECLAGLLTPTSGTIELDGRLLYSSAETINVPARNREIGYLFQNYALFPHMTVEQNVLYGLRCKKSFKQNKTKLDYRALLDSFGLLHLINRFPGQLSGGEKQRVALIRALILQPRLLLLDEPFSSLDRQSKTRLRQELKNMHKEWHIPIVLVTHDEEDAASLGNVLLSINKGQVTKNSELAVKSNVL